MVGDRPPAMRVGVTGHRRYDEPERVAAHVARVADELVERAAATEAPVEVWTSLAEGADRAVAAALVARGAALVAVLPLDPLDYADDFTDSVSRREFEQLLTSSSHLVVVGAHLPNREAAYEAAGLAVVDACSVLVALWDGEPARGRGGSAEIVAAAERRGRDVIVVPVTRGNVA